MIRERLLGEPEGLDGARLQLGMRAHTEPYAARCIKTAALREPWSPEPVLAQLSGGPARRRAAAWALGWRRERRAFAALSAALSAAAAHTDRLILGWALARCGGDEAAIRASLDGADRRRVSSWSDWREPNVALDQPLLTSQFDAMLGAEAIRARSPALDGTLHDPASLLSVALLGHPDDLEPMVAMLHSSGRRGEHAIHRAIALAGDCRAEQRLIDLLEATDADPGRGFVQRRLGALGLGRLGLSASLRVLERAVESERRDFEGRPGAGLGVQFPVRGELLLAIGELAEGGLRALPLLISHLDDTTGSAFGGMYLPAMEALCRIGPGTIQGLRQRARAAARGDAGEIGAANAVGVIAALGGDVTEFLGDRRTVVAAAAKRAQQAGRASS